MYIFSTEYIFLKPKDQTNEHEQKKQMNCKNKDVHIYIYIYIYVVPTSQKLHLSHFKGAPCCIMPVKNRSMNINEVCHCT